MHADGVVRPRLIMRFAILLLFLLSIAMVLAACSDGGDSTPGNAAPDSAFASAAPEDPSFASAPASEAAASEDVSSDSSESAVSEPASFQVPVADEGNAKEDDSIRAIGENKDGRLLVQPSSTAYVSALGAPSCYGTETALEWSGAYQAVWESKATGQTTEVISFPTDFMIIRSDDTPVQMQRQSAGDTDLYFYTPRYTDCHGLETYVFGVRDGSAFPVTFKMDDDKAWNSLSHYPGHPFEEKDGEFIAWGSWGAGQDSIDVYHFRYSDKDQALILTSTEQAAPFSIS